jgi:hypothetical protein
MKKLFLTPARPLDLMGTGGPTRALFELLPRTSAKESVHDLADVLKSVQLFENLGVEDLRRLAWLVHERTYRDDECIFEQGKPSAAMFVFRMASVEFLRRSRNGEEVHLAIVEAPASLHEPALMVPDTMHRFTARSRGHVSMIDSLQQP